MLCLFQKEHLDLAEVISPFSRAVVGDFIPLNFPWISSYNIEKSGRRVCWPAERTQGECLHSSCPDHLSEFDSRTWNGPNRLHGALQGILSVTANLPWSKIRAITLLERFRTSELKNWQSARGRGAKWRLG
jgi:hypothetical protein